MPRAYLFHLEHRVYSRKIDVLNLWDVNPEPGEDGRAMPSPTRQLGYPGPLIVGTWHRVCVATTRRQANSTVQRVGLNGTSKDAALQSQRSGATMSEMLRSFDEPILDDSGRYHARVIGRLADDGMWEGWLEFVPADGRSANTPLISPVESRQPEREHLAYWASGLSVVYAEGALRRARRPLTVRTRLVETPASDAPAPRIATVGRRAAGPEPVLDPFEVGSHSLDILAQELRALGRARLLNIIAAYDLNSGGLDLQQFTDAQLITLIVVAVEARLLHR